MIEWLRRRPLPLALAVASAVLAVVIAAEIQLGSRPDADPGPARKRASAAEAKLLPAIVATAADQAYRETAARPLFTPTRRPAPELANAAQNAFVKGQFLLQGVIITAETRVAMLREKSTGKTHRVEKGRDVNGITVAEVQPEAVTLTQGADSEVVPLIVQKAQPAPAPAGQLGPFGGAPPGAAQPVVPAQQPPTAMPVPGQAPGIPTPGAPAPAPPVRTTFDFGPLPPGVTNQLPGAQAQPQAATTPGQLSAEELLARRRARREQTQ